MRPGPRVQLRAGLGELHKGAALVHLKPATVSISVGNRGKPYLIKTVILSETRRGLNG
jgi:hypothetical protein